MGTPPIAFAEGSCLGGGSVINGGLMWRTPPWVLEQWEREHGLTGYTEQGLKPHFERIETQMHVKRHELEEDSNLDSLLLHRAAERLDWKSVLVPRAVINCIYENLCPTGCKSGAKQSMLQTYIPLAQQFGARILCGCRAVRITASGGRAKTVEAQSVSGAEKKTISIDFENLYLAGGAVQTPHLLRRSGLSRKAGSKLEFHFNLKFVALFDKPIHASHGTMFTTQIQQFEKQGILICASNTNSTYIATTLSHFDNATINHVLGNSSRAGIFVAMTRPTSKARVSSLTGDRPFVYYKFDPTDMKDIVFAIRKTVQVLFEGGASEIYLPIAGSRAIKAPEELDKVLENLKPKALELITVHVMASCPMGPDRNQSIVNPEARLWNAENVYLADAGILPTNVGESPQGTIMAFVSEAIKRQLNP